MMDNRLLEIVFADMKGYNQQSGITPYELFDKIVNWCRLNIKNKKWSHNRLSGSRFANSYGAKHICQREIGYYVANNWMKAAMIAAGLMVTDIRNVNEDNRVTYKPVTFADIFATHCNFICRVKPEGQHPRKGRG